MSTESVIEAANITTLAEAGGRSGNKKEDFLASWFTRRKTQISAHTHTHTHVPYTDTRRHKKKLNE